MRLSIPASHRCLASVSTMLCLVAAAGCSSSSGSPATDDGGGGGAGSGGSGGSGQDGGAETVGEVEFQSGGVKGSLTSGAYSIVGVFATGSGHATIGDQGPCEAPVAGCTVCNNAADGGTKGSLSIKTISAGTLTLKDGATTITSVAYDAAEGVYDYDSNSHPSLAWNPGDSLSVSASGASGMFPAFSGAITAPQYIAGVSPAISLTQPITAPAADDFTVSWTPSTDDGSMQLLLSSTKTLMSVSCVADESAGKATVPSSLLAKLGTGAGTVIVDLLKTVKKTIPLTGVTLSITAAPPAIDGTLSLQ